MSEVSLKIASWLASGLYVLLQIKSIVTSYIFSITYMCRANAIDSRDQIVSHKVSMVSISGIAYHICLSFGIGHSYPSPPGLLHRHLGSQMIAPVPVKQP